MVACSRTILCITRGLPTFGLAIVGLALAGWVSLAATQLNAQDPVLSELYGRGVHQYFAGHYSDAHELLDLTIKEGDLDPRAYYFRGLSYARLGRPDEAKADFARAAELEVMNTQSAFNVGRALERIQGGERLEIERIRRMARVAARGKTKRRSRARYERFKEAEPRVLRGAPTGPSAPGGAPAIPPAAPLEGNAQPIPDPFGAGGLGSGQVTPAKPAAPKPTPGAPSKPMPVAPDEDPFGNDADPFGDKNDAPKADADTDPFGDAPSPPPADDDDPFK